MQRILVLSAIVFSLQSGSSRFADHKVDLTFVGTSANVDLTSHPWAKTFRTRLREGNKTGPNFADHYTVVTWGCGTGCQMLAIINAKDGKVYFLPQGAIERAVYRRDSKLLITDPIDSSTVKLYGGNFPEHLYTRYYLWDGTNLNQIDSSRAVTGTG